MGGMLVKMKMMAMATVMMMVAVVVVMMMVKLPAALRHQDRQSPYPHQGI
jgi:hypothetical protein